MSAVSILLDCLWFGSTAYDENCNIIPASQGWKIKKNTDTGNLQIIYLDDLLSEHVIQEFSPPEI